MEDSSFRSTDFTITIDRVLEFEKLLTLQATMSSSSEDLEEYQLGVLETFEAHKKLVVLKVAGTGNSFILSRIIALAKERHGVEHGVTCAVTNNAPRNKDNRQTRTFYY